MRGTAAADRQSRPGRRALVAADLSMLRGPVSGVVVLPNRLVWAPAPAGRFDLDDPFDRLRVYEIVLREAVHEAELRRWLNGAVLVEVWPHLYLPRGVRQAWEAIHPQLAVVPAR
ncbi:hypothetical protein [Actinoplanes sp. NPDC049802]|uniref:hypothetical protein n=1 Tax=Actinoplanes sp. NPDC049802 TaxID=3154742 RepID=UPI00340DC96A